MRFGCAGLALVPMVMTGALWAQTPAAPAPAPTIRNSTQVPAAPVAAGADRGSTGEMPMNTPGDEPATDTTPAASPIAAGARGNVLLPGTQLRLQMVSAVDSAHQHNGDVVQATLLAPVRTVAGQTLRQGTPVSLTVLSSAAAGTIQSYGVLTLQVLRVGPVGVYSNVLDFNGQEGARLVADAAPAKGTEARLDAGSMLQFSVLGAGNQWDGDRGGQRGIGKGGSGQGSGQTANPNANQGSNSGAAAQGNTANQGVTSPAPATSRPH